MKPSLRVILNRVASQFGVTEAELTNGTRRRHVAEPRMVAMLLMREQRATCVQVAAVFGRCHSDVTHACERVRSLCDAHPTFRADVEACRGNGAAPSHRSGGG